MVLIILLQVTIVLIVLRVIKQGDPLFVLVVLLDRVVQEVLLQRNRYRAEKLLIVQVLYNDANDFFRLGIPQGHHDRVGIFQIGAVHEFHIPVDIESHFFFVFFVVNAWLEINVVYLHIQLVAKLELGASYITEADVMNIIRGQNRKELPVLAPLSLLTYFASLA